MKFIRLVWLDIKNGYVKQPLFYIFPLFIVGMGFADSYRQVSVWETKSALGDYWLYLYGGMKEYVPTLGNPFQFPAIWIMVFLMSSFLVMSYPMRDLQSTGTQMLVHAQGRSKWWISKCFWNLFSTFSYHITVLLLIVLLCIFVDVPITWEIHQKTIISMFSLGIEDFQGGNVIPFSVFLAPIVFSMALNMLQMFLTLYVKPIFSFLFVSIIMLASSYLMNNGMIGNYAMPIRYSWAVSNGISHENGLMVSTGILLFSIVVGLIRFRRYDILNDD